MVSIDRVVVTIFNLPDKVDKSLVEKEIKKAFFEIHCLGIRPDWVFFQFPSYPRFRKEDTVVWVYLETMEKDRIDPMMTDMVSEIITFALDFILREKNSLTVEVKPFDIIYDEPCLGQFVS